MSSRQAELQLELEIMREKRRIIQLEKETVEAKIALFSLAGGAANSPQQQQQQVHAMTPAMSTATSEAGSDYMAGLSLSHSPHLRQSHAAHFFNTAPQPTVPSPFASPDFSMPVHGQPLQPAYNQLSHPVPPPERREQPPASASPDISMDSFTQLMNMSLPMPPPSSASGNPHFGALETALNAKFFMDSMNEDDLFAALAGDSLTTGGGIGGHAGPVGSAERASRAEEDEEEEEEDEDEPVKPAAKKKANAGSSSASIAAGVGGRRKKAVTELSCVCKQCQKNIATVFITGVVAGDGALSIASLCLPCCGLNNGAAKVLGKKRKKGTGAILEEFETSEHRKVAAILGDDVMEVECRLCTVRLGVGTIKTDEGNLKEEIRNDLAIDVICAKCFSEFRSGKWRPKEMFTPGRKTCLLSHKRLGKPEKFRYVTYRLPVHQPGVVDQKIPPTLPYALYKSNPMSHVPYTNLPTPQAIDAIVKDATQAFHHCWLSLMAEATYMRDSRALYTWERVVARQGRVWKNIETFIRGRFRPDIENIDGEIRRYMCVGFIPVGANGEGGEAGKGVTPGEERYAMSGFMCMQWDMQARVVCAGEVAHHAKVQLSKSSMLPHFCWAVMQAIAEDVATVPRELEPKHVWTWLRLRLNTTGKAFMKLVKGLQLIEIGEYVVKEGLNKEEGEMTLYEKRMWDDMFSDNLSVDHGKYVISWPDSLKPI
ncbi:hypothetical protein HK101_009349 [Irineochytrium annulatum]|nr:hypothetical protein HK101_009349 [Irineochytrium annulatum]